MYKYCPHCQKQCNIKTFREHKRLYFNFETNSWVNSLDLLPKNSLASDVESDSTLDLSSENEMTKELSLNSSSNSVQELGGETDVTQDMDAARPPDTADTGRVCSC